MSRDIKFRGRHTESGEWIYGYLIGKDVIVGNIVDWDDEYFCTEYWYKVDPTTVGQYTGLKDRNGKDIYEGDIIAIECDCDPGEYAICNHPPEISKIVWDQECASFATRTATSKWGEAFEESMTDVYEVIGNIYENPSLLGDTGGDEV